jgi:hypothetical protein
LHRRLEEEEEEEERDLLAEDEIDIDEEGEFEDFLDTRTMRIHRGWQQENIESVEQEQD